MTQAHPLSQQYLTFTFLSKYLHDFDLIFLFTFTLTQIYIYFLYLFWSVYVLWKVVPGLYILYPWSIPCTPWCGAVVNSPWWPTATAGLFIWCSEAHIFPAGWCTRFGGVGECPLSGGLIGKGLIGTSILTLFLCFPINLCFSQIVNNNNKNYSTFQNGFLTPHHKLCKHYKTMQ